MLEQLLPLAPCDDDLDFWLLVSHPAQWGDIKIYYSATEGSNVELGVASSGAQMEHIFEYNLMTGASTPIFQTTANVELGGGYVAGAEISVDNNTGGVSRSAYFGGDVKVAQGQIEFGSDGDMSLEASAGHPTGAFGYGVGVRFSNSRNIDLTAVRYNDVAKYSRQGGLQGWVSRVTGLPMQQHLGQAWDDERLIYLAQDKRQWCLLQATVNGNEMVGINGNERRQKEARVGLWG